MSQKVRFAAVDGTEIFGDLHLPAGAAHDLPGVVLIGPMTSCKEQVLTEYATRMAAKGYAAFVFDPRYCGESGGEPRCWENPAAKVEDIGSAVSYLASRPEVDAGRIAELAICQGSSEMLPGAADDPRIRVFATVAGHHRDHEGDVAWLTEDGYQAHLAKAKAKARYTETGEAEYVPAVDRTRTDVGMPGELVWCWYQPWADRGVWENRYAVHSDADLLAYEALSAAGRANTRWLMVHSDQCMLPDAARRHFDAAPTANEQLAWKGDTPHLHFYDHPEVIDPTVEMIDGWFRRHIFSSQDRRGLVIESVNRMGLHADLGEWDALREIFADEVLVDYTSLDGGEAETMSRDALVERWHGELPGWDALQHIITNHVVTLAGDRAECRSHFRAQHRLGDGDGQRTWELDGHYHHQLRLDGRRWLITAVTMRWTFERGDRALSGEAAARARVLLAKEQK